MSTKSLSITFCVLSIILLVIINLSPRTALTNTSVAPDDVRTYSSSDIMYALNEQDLVQRSTLIIVGTPYGNITEVTTSDGKHTLADGSNAQDIAFSYYQQPIKIEEVLKGNTESDSIEVLRGGVSSDAIATGVIADGALGPLAQGRQILFLEPSGKAGVFQVVGHASGELSLDNAGQVSSARPEAIAFQGLSITEVKSKINELSVIK